MTSPPTKHSRYTAHLDVKQNGSAIRELRVKAGLKPGDLAASAGVSYPHLDNVENERKDASIELLHRIANAIPCRVQSIVRDPAILTATPSESRSA